MRPGVLSAFLTALVLAGAALAGSAQARVPRGFVGMVVDGPVYPGTASGVDLGHQLDRMVAAGVERLRVEFSWAAAQPYRHWSQVPASEQSRFTDVDGIPTRFALMDRIVVLAALRHITVLPVVLYTPKWDAAPHSATTFAIPRRDAPYARFVSALVQRYGSNGDLWQLPIPRVPVTMWQVWNEPNITVFWPKQPFERSYVALLRAAHDAIKQADPSAKVVLAGMPNFSWIGLAKIYEIPGARGLFDVVGVHPYTKWPQGVITILHNIRQVMDQAGDGNKPMIADEISWPSSVGKTSHDIFGLGTTEAGQASRLATLLPLLGQERNKLKLIGFDYYTWAGLEDRGGRTFDFAGLLRYQRGQLLAKPAYYAFRKAALALEACGKKGSLATECAGRKDRRSRGS